MQPNRAPAMSLEQENDLKQFLKIVRPDWSISRRSGQNDIARACGKLKAIGVQDVADLLSRVTSNTINDDLYKANKPRFSRETIQSIRKEGAFWQSLSRLNEPSYRQIGLFAPVPQMLAGKKSSHRGSQGKWFTQRIPRFITTG